MKRFCTCKDKCDLVSMILEDKVRKPKCNSEHYCVFGVTEKEYNDRKFDEMIDARYAQEKYDYTSDHESFRFKYHCISIYTDRYEAFGGQRQGLGLRCVSWCMARIEFPIATCLYNNHYCTTLREII